MTKSWYNSIQGGASPPDTISTIKVQNKTKESEVTSMVVIDLYLVSRGRMCIIGEKSETVYFIGNVDLIPVHLLDETVTAIIPLNKMLYVYINR